MRRVAAALLVLVLAGCASPTDPASPTPSTTPPAPKEFAIVRIDTEAGPISAILYPDAAPLTVALMRAYFQEGYFVGREFNRIVPGHVIQITDIANGLTEDLRRAPLETKPGHSFAAGALGIARGNHPDSGGPEIFIMDYATSHLDGNYTVWGQVIQGLDVVHQIARGPAYAFPASPVPDAPVGPPTDRLALDPVAITKAEETPRKLTHEGAQPYPLHVARNARVGSLRHSLEWPDNVGAPGTHNLTWYARPYDSTIPPEASRVRIALDNETRTVAPDAGSTGIYHFTWSPSGPGVFPATLMVDGVAWATLTITVPRP